MHLPAPARRCAFAWLLALSACAAEPAAAVRADTAATNPLPQSTTIDERFAGTVRARLRAGSYSYLEIDDGVHTRWVAVMGEGLPEGSRAQVHAVARRRDFHSRRLDRRFDELDFASVRAHGATPAEPSLPRSTLRSPTP
ncbi:MAG: hypothetical protein K1X88_14980 [Nannocystaceae bacterium]|nr:hypothetical protein [Nannocystaceae bacterium]